VQAVLERTLELDESYEHGAVHGYLGILNSLRPPALGGQPEIARQTFRKRAIELLGGARICRSRLEYARRYARLVSIRNARSIAERGVERAGPKRRGSRVQRC